MAKENKIDKYNLIVNKEMQGNLIKDKGLKLFQEGVIDLNELYKIF